MINAFDMGRIHDMSITLNTRNNEEFQNTLKYLILKS